VLGAGLGIASAWVGGRFDRIVSAACNVLFAFPAILLAMVAAAFFGLGVRAVSIALTIAYLPMLARLIRASALRESSLPYVVALRLQGLSAVRICARHLVPNLMGIIVAQASIAFAWAMIDLSAVSFLGLGVQPPNQDWGAMLNQGAEGMLQGYPLEAIVVCAAFVIVVCAVTVLSDRLLSRADAGA
jgi:peptide/nickel transport system permease protein